MFAFPAQTVFGKTIPKARIYAHADPTRRVRDLFTHQVAEIRWTHKLSPETLHLAAKPEVPEIEIFEIQLKSDKLDTVVLETIDRAIPYPILHRIHSTKGVAYSAAFKRPSEADSQQWVVGARFTSDFADVPADDLPPLPTALDLGNLYAALVAPLLPLPARKGERLGDHIARCDQFQKVSRKVDQLTSRIGREKQFNRKVTLNEELKPLKLELDSLTQ